MRKTTSHEQTAEDATILAYDVSWGAHTQAGATHTHARTHARTHANPINGRERNLRADADGWTLEKGFFSV